MKKYKYILIIMVISLTLLSCTKNEDAKSSSSIISAKEISSEISSSSSKIENSGSTSTGINKLEDGTIEVKDSDDNTITVSGNTISINENNFTTESMKNYVITKDKLEKFTINSDYNTISSEIGVLGFKINNDFDDTNINDKSEKDNVVYFDENYSPIVIEIKGGKVENIIK